MDITNLVALVSSFVAFLGVGLVWWDGRKSRQMMTLLEIGKDYRDGWRTRWHMVPDARVRFGSDVTAWPIESRRALVDALNWIDWFGIGVRDGIVPRPSFIYRTLGPSMHAIIVAGRTIIAEDVEEHGQLYWAGVLYIERTVTKQGYVPFSAAWDAEVVVKMEL